MTKKVTTLKGRQIDLGALREAHGATIALGNTKMNARGDLLGRGGAIVKHKEDVVRDYYENNPKAVTVSSVSLKDIADEVMTMTPAEAVAAIEAQAKRQAAPAPKRKIKDED
jgi:hypothetical protein